jgi:histidinol-phosphate aminotransferase
MSPYWSTVVHSLTPYVPGEQPRIAGLVKLNTNENPYGPGPRRRWRPSLPPTTTTCGSTPTRPRCELRQRHRRIPRRGADEVFVGNGSDEVLAHAFCALLRHQRPLRLPGHQLQLLPGLLRARTASGSRR